ncbi:substrate-binding domain-containing protein [Undibacterium rugosum]|uniref:Substrate-binding domain-containing protein n=1 Tax=Undibacterium rugosum TaxID=2762291 RepID=A0A923I245_9BURK|nr:substrate-binding domain-containing protein [Undibacterium rugosum]MBC3934599.1 substrate-binding domain-containing protein [Undibacterium rugosum]MBR7777213.1 substrate-binding domain-containing protein [Undibacterium rugosum]
MPFANWISVLILPLTLMCVSGTGWARDSVGVSATAPAYIWDGPRDGPPALPGKRISFIGQDMRNGGISSVYRSLYLAALELGWTLDVYDGKGDVRLFRSLLKDGLTQRLDGVVLAGIDIDDEFQDLVSLAQKKAVVLVGWHAGTMPGASKQLFVNITTHYEQVARKAAELLVETGGAAKGIIILNDKRFKIANAKTAVMKEVISNCRLCSLLAVENIEIGNVNLEIPAAVHRWNLQFGSRWTHTLAINDAYFDAMNIPLMSEGRRDIVNIAAGDGSYIALNRIKSGKSQQLATIAEPLGIQGWQLADELNRAFSGSAPSGYVSSPIVVTSRLLSQLKGADIDTLSNFKEYYRQIWFARAKTDLGQPRVR